MADIEQELYDLITTRYGSVMKSSILGALEKLYAERRHWIIDDEEEEDSDGQTN